MMMENFYTYIAQVNVALLVFYLLYRMLFVRDTFLGTRRLFLLTSVVLAFMYPFVSFSSWIEARESLQIVMVNYTELLNATVSVVIPAETTAWTWQHVLLWIWGTGGVILFFRMLFQFFRIWQMAGKGKRILCQGQTVITLPRETAPFSFFNWIFLNPDSYESKELSEIIAHEKAHVSQWHSFDMVLGEILCIFFWFNPIIWLLRKEIRQNLEFLADKKVVTAGYNRKNYQYHLLRLSHQLTAVQIVNNFNVSPLKKRIIMMNKKRTSRIGLLKYALLVPVTGLLILSANAGTVVEMVGNTLEGWKNVLPQDLKEESKILTGKVLDENNKALPGATVLIQGTVIGAVTDANGRFRLTADKPGNLCISYIGKKTEFRTFDLKSGEFKIKLEKDNFQLEKIVVTGYAAENEPKEGEEIFVAVEEMPVFPFGNVLRYIAKNIKYPVIAQTHGIEGTVYVSFVVNKEGQVTNAKVVRGVDASLDKEGLRVVNSLPAWKPGKQRGKAVDVQYTIPIEFRLMRKEAATVTTVTSSEKGKEVTTITTVTTEMDEGGNIKTFVIPDVKKEGTAEMMITVKDAVQKADSIVITKKAFYVVDGKKMGPDFKIENLSPDKITNIQVLTEKSAVAIYGDDAKHGVIVITTKK